MSTNMLGLQSFFSFLHNSVLAKLATNSIRVNTKFIAYYYIISRTIIDANDNFQSTLCMKGLKIFKYHTLYGKWMC